ncbi:NAD(P)-dependent oxidoreductase [Pseudoroseomonas globiformis]|uniref:NAD(P)-dependent oxidoreductase n=1 Tax=Teichococcus globiformis TaxID=2307229 RepID=A0ABV7FVP6_9PROT
MKVFLSHTDEQFAGYYGDRALAALAGTAEVARNRSGRVLQGEELARAAAGCHAIIAHRATPGDAATFAAAPDLVAFLRCAVDISTIDVPAASAQGILVTRATPGFTDAVAELGLGMMIDLGRGITDAAAGFRSGSVPAARMGRQLRGATLGLIGYGRIARRLGELAEAAGMAVRAHDPALGEAGATLDEVLIGSDFVVCLAAATPETDRLMNADRFARMRHGAFFINLSRGQLVDEAALEAALESGHLAGAALDVGMAPDQMPPGRLAARHDVIATPHVGGLTPEATEHQAMDTVRQIEALAAGRMPEGAANAEAAHRLRRLLGQAGPAG